jgi:hypothetical protein
MDQHLRHLGAIRDQEEIEAQGFKVIFLSTSIESESWMVLEWQDSEERTSFVQLRIYDFLFLFSNWKISARCPSVSP